jgi:8-oxo-dGTP diphosphatase
MGSEFVNTTVCYIRANGKTLMMQRTTNDAMLGKWIVPGGKFEPGETPEDCVIREIKEETGIDLEEVRLRGILTFVRNKADQTQNTCTCFVFESFNFRENEFPVADGEIRWVEDGQMTSLDLPASDHIFLPWIYQGTEFFSAKFSAGLKHVVFYG